MDRRLLALLSGVLLGTVSESSLAPALPVLERAFAVGPEAAQGVVSLGLLGAALAYLPLAGLAGRVGAGRLFRTGLFLHALSALLLALAPSLWALYLLRLLQGVATAMVVGLVPGLAASAFPEARGYALGMVASTVAAGTLLGPALGGLAAGWGLPYVFLLPLPAALLALLLSGNLPELPRQEGTLPSLLRAPGFLPALLATGLYFLHTLGTTVALAFHLGKGFSPGPSGASSSSGPWSSSSSGPGRGGGRTGWATTGWPSSGPTSSWPRASPSPSSPPPPPLGKRPRPPPPRGGAGPLPGGEQRPRPLPRPKGYGGPRLGGPLRGPRPGPGPGKRPRRGSLGLFYRLFPSHGLAFAATALLLTAFMGLAAFLVRSREGSGEEVGHAPLDDPGGEGGA